jgi:hypothetical protein
MKTCLLNECESTGISVIYKDVSVNYTNNGHLIVTEPKESNYNQNYITQISMILRFLKKHKLKTGNYLLFDTGSFTKLT